MVGLKIGIAITGGKLNGNTNYQNQIEII